MFSSVKYFSQIEWVEVSVVGCLDVVLTHRHRATFTIAEAIRDTLFGRRALAMCCTSVT